MKNISNKSLRILLVTNLLSLVGLVIIYDFTNNLKTDIFYLIFFPGLIIFIPLLVITYIYALKRTRLWKRVHLQDDDLDEREIKENYKVMKSSYAIFTISIIALIYLYELGGLSVSVITAAGALYFAHFLPAFISGWKHGIPQQE